MKTKNQMKTVEKSSEKSSEKILILLRENSYLSSKEIAKILNISSRAVEKNISKLKEKGIIERVGADKGGHWEVKNEI